MRSVLGFDVEAGDAEERDVQSEGIRSATAPEMETARKIWATGVRSKNTLKKIKMPALQGLCQDHNIVIATQEGRMTRREELVAALLNSVAVVSFLSP